MNSLRIFYAADDSPGGPHLPASRLWRQNLLGALTDLGHDVVEFRYDRMPETFANLDPANPKQAAFIEENKPRLSRELVRQIEQAHHQKPFQAFFSYFYSACVTDEAIRAIRDLGITTINWYCNASYQFHLIKEIAPAYDWCLVPEEYRIADYTAIGANPIYCQEAANPNIYRPYPVEERYDVVFLGQRYGDRPELMGRLFAAGLDVHAFGAGWQEVQALSNPSLANKLWWAVQHPIKVSQRLAGKIHHRPATDITARRSDSAEPPGGAPLNGARRDLPPENRHAPLDDEDMIRMYSRSRVALGFGTCGDTHRSSQRIYQIRLRDFEAPMAGACYLTEYSDEYARFFEPDVEVAMYKTPDEMVEKAHRLVMDEAWRNGLRQAGRKRALAEHTWQKRFEAVFRQIGLTS